MVESTGSKEMTFLMLPKLEHLRRISIDYLEQKRVVRLV